MYSINLNEWISFIFVKKKTFNMLPFIFYMLVEKFDLSTMWIEYMMKLSHSVSNKGVKYRGHPHNN